MRSVRPALATLGSVVVLASACGDDGGQSHARLGGVTVSERAWTDTSRSIPRTPARTLRTMIWEPSDPGPRPLLLLAHGFGGLPEKFDAFAHTIAAAGYRVAAPAFPLTNENAPGGHEQGLSDFRNQPGDVSFVLTRLLDANADPADALYGRIDPDQIALLGHSLGGLTALAATRKDCCRDARIKAVVSVAPLVELFLSQFGPDSIADGPPMLIVHGEADTTIPFESSVDLYAEIDPPKFLVRLTDVGHSEALESQVEPAPPARRAAEEMTIAFLESIFSERPQEFADVLAELTSSGNLVQAAP